MRTGGLAGRVQDTECVSVIFSKGKFIFGNQMLAYIDNRLNCYNEIVLKIQFKFTF
jgi:hypothetical protein